MRALKIVVIDNYDSFTYNLVHMLKELNADVTVLRNNQFEINDISEFDKILISPGPGIPSEAGLTKEVINTYADKKPILGICLGHQAIAECFGGELINLTEVYHGFGTNIKLHDDYLFNNCSSETKVGRYHSWVVNPKLPSSLQLLATDENNMVMALKHKEFDVRGIQFHPESVLTPEGFQMIKNWVEN